MSALADYYAAQANEHNAQVPLLSQQARQVGIQADDLSANDAAANADRYASAGLATAQSKSLLAKTPGEIAATYAGAGLQGAQATSIAGKTPYEIAGLGLSNDQASASFGTGGSGLGAALANAIKNKSVGFEKGGMVGRDKAKPGKTDTVPTMLAPGEAVINKGAVDHYGSDVIDHMNKMGLMRTKAHKEVSKIVDKHLGMASSKKAAKRKA